jgi:hypothetical protein
MTRIGSLRGVLEREVAALERSFEDERARVARDAALLALIAAGVSHSETARIMRADFGVKWQAREISAHVRKATERRDRRR